MAAETKLKCPSQLLQDYSFQIMQHSTKSKQTHQLMLVKDVPKRCLGPLRDIPSYTKWLDNIPLGLSDITGANRGEANMKCYYNIFKINQRGVFFVQRVVWWTTDYL